MGRDEKVPFDFSLETSEHSASVPCELFVTVNDEKAVGESKSGIEGRFGGKSRFAAWLSAGRSGGECRSQMANLAKPHLLTAVVMEYPVSYSFFVEVIDEVWDQGRDES